MKSVQSVRNVLATLAVLLSSGVPLSDLQAVTVECLLVTNAPLPGAKQPRSLVARMTASWVDDLLTDDLAMGSEMQNLSTGQYGIIFNYYHIDSTPVFQYTNVNVDSGTTVLLSRGAAVSPVFGFVNEDVCAAEGNL